MIKRFIFLTAAILAAVLIFKKQGGEGFISPLTNTPPDQASPSSQVSSPSPSPSPSPTPIPLPDPKIYGPCRNVPVLLYHHVQPREEAEEKGQTSFSVNTDIFASQMQYLATKGYTTLTPSELLAGLTASSLAAKSVLVTFDDGYEDVYKYAYPELVKNGIKATIFLNTGLVGNMDYLKWNQVMEMKGSGLITFGNHTWSHKNLGNVGEDTIRFEVGTVNTQLEERGLGPVDAFAYPYGFKTSKVDKILGEFGIKTAFTTVPGWYQCAKLPYDLRRNRVGNSSLSAYGL